MYELKEEKPTVTCRQRPGIHIGDYVAVQKIIRAEWIVDVENGQVINGRTGEPVAFYKNKGGYLKCNARSSGFQIDICKHRIIWVAANLLNYLPLNYNLMIDHINGDKEDNRIVNLQLTTNSVNILKGKKTSMHHVFSDDEVRKIRREFSAGARICELSRKYNADRTTVSRIVRNLSYRSVV